jgi:DNA polymerase I
LNSSQPANMVIIDGNSLLYRAFYALPPLQNRRGEHTNAVYGFLNMLLRLLDEKKPAYIAVAFDPPKPSFRVRIDENYKAQREKTPPELSEQIQRTREILAAMRIPVFVVDDFEADDVIATLADRYASAGQEVTIVSGDADLLQLIGEGVTVLLTKKGISSMERYDAEKLKEEYGLLPEQVIDFKALKGDPSDNIPGVPGVGEKTARSMLEKYDNLENIYANIDHLKARIASNLREYRDQLYTGKELVTLRRDLDLKTDLEQCRLNEPDYDRLLPMLQELEFKSLISRLKPGQDERVSQKEKTLQGVRLESAEELSNLLNNLGAGETLSALLRLAGGWPAWKQPALVLALATGPNDKYYLDLTSFPEKEAEIWLKLSTALENGVTLLVHNGKLWHHIFMLYGLNPPVVSFDTYLAAYLADPARGNYDLSTLLQHNLGLTLDQLEEGGRKEFAITTVGLQMAEAAGHLFALRELLVEQLREQELEKLLNEMEVPLSAVLARMEQQGLSVNKSYLQDLSADICRRLVDLEEKIYEQAGEKFNINSPQQLSKILFDKLKLPAIRKTKTGRSTDAKVLEELALHHDIAALLLHYRQLAKLEGTYLSGLIELIDNRERKIYTTFNQAATATGRLSSSDPNLQNIPIRLEEGRRIRRAFVPSSEEKILFAADYSQVELRILAHLSEDPILVEAFRTGQDIHRRTAAEVNGVNLEDVTALMREKAKAVNFGIIYGSSDYGLAQNLKIPRAEAKAYIDRYFEHYKGVKAYMEQIVAEAREKGYVKTMFNRRRYLPEINSSNFNIRSFAERMALNTPIQGSAADIIKLAMLRIDQIIGEGGFQAAMILQIHDELLFEIPEREIDFFAPLIRREMEEAYSLAVPLQVDLKWGKCWEDLKEL